jgi:hypothetical protein
MQFVVATAGDARLLDGIVETPYKAKGERIDSDPDRQPIIARAYSKTVFELRDREVRLATSEQGGAEGDPSLSVARVPIYCLFKNFDTPGRVAQVGKGTTGKAKHLGAVAIEGKRPVRLRQGFVGLRHMTDQVTYRQ